MKRFLSKRLSIFTMALATVMVSISSCKKDEVEPVVYGDAKIKVVNATQGSTPQDLYHNDVMLAGSTVAYGNASQYFTVKGGTSVIATKNTGSTTTTTSLNGILDTGVSYTFFYVSDGTNGSTVLRAISDDNSTVSGKAKIRFINLGTIFNNSINVNLSSGTSVITGLSSNAASGYQQIDPNVELRATVIGSTPVTISGSNFVAGKNYTVWFDAVNSTTLNYHIILQN